MATVNVKPAGSRPSLLDMAYAIKDKADRAEKKKPAEEEAPVPSKKAKKQEVVRKAAAKKKPKKKPADKSTLTIAKEHALQHGTYMAIVRRLNCRRCGAPPPSERKGNEFCHRDEGKGLSLKTDVREGWAGCPPCHKLVGEGKMPRAEKRALNDEYAGSTRAEVDAKGLWPKNLPRWKAKA